ncbi:MAG: nickel-dependent lactate racemase [Synergistaceae bacterium]|jgi:nickel-dependent lactate racemase|nr:nickel-dependent lactate racemase [Synergistaceae bacterium]
MGVYDLKFGKGSVKIEIRDEDVLGLMKSREAHGAGTEAEVIAKALENPIGSTRLSEKVNPGETVCVVVCDLTRSWQRPSVYLPVLLQEIKKGGAMDEDIFFLIATGTHRAHSPAEHRAILGDEVYARYRVFDHDCLASAMTDFGRTTSGTPVRLNKLAADASHVILTGAITYHFLSGWSGGRKSVLPGIASYESVMANHALALNPLPTKGRNDVCRSGNVDGNLIHLDMTEAAAMLAPSFLLNVVMNADGKIGQAVAGDWRLAHEAGMRALDSIDRIEIPRLADLVIASACGYPKDINLYQSAKTLFNAQDAVRPGGAIVMLASCAEGYGNDEMQMILREFKDADGREAELRRAFTIAKYVGYCTALAAERFDFHLVTDIDPGLLDGTGIRISRTADEALAKVRAAHGANLKTWIMPHGAYTLPRLA